MATTVWLICALCVLCAIGSVWGRGYCTKQWRNTADWRHEAVDATQAILVGAFLVTALFMGLIGFVLSIRFAVGIS